MHLYEETEASDTKGVISACPLIPLPPLKSPTQKGATERSKSPFALFYGYRNTNTATPIELSPKQQSPCRPPGTQNWIHVPSENYFQRKHLLSLLILYSLPHRKVYIFRGGKIGFNCRVNTGGMEIYWRLQPPQAQRQSSTRERLQSTPGTYRLILGSWMQERSF